MNTFVNTQDIITNEEINILQNPIDLLSPFVDDIVLGSTPEDIDYVFTYLSDQTFELFNAICFLWTTCSDGNQKWMKLSNPEETSEDRGFPEGIVFRFPAPKKQIEPKEVKPTVSNEKPVSNQSDPDSSFLSFIGSSVQSNDLNFDVFSGRKRSKFEEISGLSNLEPQTQKLTANEYCIQVILWIETELNDQEIFPSDARRVFPDSFIVRLKYIWRRMFRILIVIYANECLLEKVESHEVLKAVLYFGWRNELLVNREVKIIGNIAFELREEYENDLKQVDFHDL
eukprot:snap_masked-scaffold_15-processed-gene-5.15-mRNA-1 protein AED:1.00 eAED:1.00 QI:0/-1/0/0/-1/1/1/0/284